MKLLFILIFLSSCTYGPKSEKKSSLNYLNGKHYDQTANIVGVPVLKRKDAFTEISGELKLNMKPFPIPLGNKILILADKLGKEITRTNTSSDGKFKFSEILKNEAYFIKINSKKMKLNHKVIIESYEHKGLKLLVDSK